MHDPLTFDHAASVAPIGLDRPDKLDVLRSKYKNARAFAGR
jgi:hypothetical protein